MLAESQDFHKNIQMGENLSRLEASAILLGRRHKVDVWSAVLAHAIEPPELFYATGVYRQMLRESGVNVSMQDVRGEIRDFSAMEMVAETNEHDLPPGTRVYHRVDSPGWEMVTATVETFNLWYPGAKT